MLRLQPAPFVDRSMLRTLVVLVVAASLSSAAHAQRFGVMAGGNFQRLGDIRLNDLETTFQSHNGWHVGLWLELPMGPVGGLRFGGRYLAAGELFTGLSDEFAVREDFDVSLAELFGVIRYGIGTPLVSPYVLAGPVFRFPVATDKAISNDLAALSYGLEIGGGLRLPIGGVTLYPEVAYTFGLSRFIEDELVLDFITLTVGDPQRLNAAYLRLSVGF